MFDVALSAVDDACAPLAEVFFASRSMVAGFLARDVVLRLEADPDFRVVITAPCLALAFVFYHR